MNTFIRTSDTSRLNDIRRQLWESIYSDFSNMNTLMDYIKEYFPPNCIEVSFNFNDMTITIESNSRPLDKEEIEQGFTLSYTKFAGDMYAKGIIDTYEYLYIPRISKNLFFITFNNNGIAKVHL